MAVLRAAKVETAESKSRPSWQPWLGRGSRVGLGMEAQGALARLPAS